MGFIFKNISSDDMGLTVQTVNEPLTAAVKKKKRNPVFMDGTLDYSDITGELFYEDKVIEYTLRFKCKSLNDFNARLDVLAPWLTGSGAFISCRGKRYKRAECYGGIDVTPQFHGHFGEFNVVFVVPPFAEGENKP